MDVFTIAIDLAKDVFEVAVASRAGRILDCQRLRAASSSDGLTRSSRAPRRSWVVRHLALLGTPGAGSWPAGAAPSRAGRAA